MYYIKSRISFEGIHSWPLAPDRVAFLRVPHRHTFTIFAKKVVTHSDRASEFIMLKHDIIEWLTGTYIANDNILQLHHTSCEMLSELIAKKFDLIECEVFEDMENSGGYEA